MNPQLLLQVVTRALAREQQASDQLEAALLAKSAEIDKLKSELADAKKPARFRR